jgi:hypothetical protein
MNSGQTKDAVFEALFRQAVIDDYLDEIAAIPAGAELSRAYPFAAAFELRMKRLFTQERCRETIVFAARFARQAAVVFAVLATALFGALLTNSEVRATVKALILEKHKFYTSFVFSGDTAESSVLKDLYPAYVPDGYHETGDTTTYGDLVRMVFAHENGDYISFVYYLSGSAQAYAESEHHRIEEGLINGHTAVIVEAMDSRSCNGVVYFDDGHVIDIYGWLPIEELIRMAESVYERQ